MSHTTSVVLLAIACVLFAVACLLELVEVRKVTSMALTAAGLAVMDFVILKHY